MLTPTPFAARSAFQGNESLSTQFLLEDAIQKRFQFDGILLTGMETDGEAKPYPGGARVERRIENYPYGVRRRVSNGDCSWR